MLIVSTRFPHITTDRYFICFVLFFELQRLQVGGKRRRRRPARRPRKSTRTKTRRTSVRSRTASSPTLSNATSTTPARTARQRRSSAQTDSSSPSMTPELRNATCPLASTVHKGPKDVSVMVQGHSKNNPSEYGIDCQCQLVNDSLRTDRQTH